MSSSKKKVTLNSVSINLGCGTCRRPKLSFIFNPKQKHKKHHIHNNSSSSSSSSSNSNPWRQRDRHKTETSSSTSNATAPTTKTSFDSNKSPSLKGLGRVGNEGVAVEKDSDYPYLDFRHSMLQMILENEICCKDDLRELLKCFLELNSVEHHGIIIRAFTEIRNRVFSVNSGFSPGFNLNRMSR
ncbi:transcription repressor OFP6-like [Vicia villosa]|uniref:transcription repressor OFP6-like n=1 Tax=Vicia villosa TaxID=3911 RepID=UPI00273ACA13|nr:transcription repressor OFP6-like [Vicia villosa]